MVCQPNLLPLLKFGDYEVVSYEARWLSDEITKAAKTDGVVSSLKIKNVVMESFGDYSCSVKNDYGEDTKPLKLNRIGWVVGRKRFY